MNIITAKDMKFFATNPKSNWKSAGAAKLALIESQVRLGIKEYTPASISTTYQPINSAMIPRIIPRMISMISILQLILVNFKKHFQSNLPATA